MSSDLPDGALGAGGKADRPGSDDDEVPVRRLAVIQLGRHRLAIPVESVRAIIDPPETVTRVPRTPPAIAGVTDVRGQITVLVDPHVHFPDSGGPDAGGSLLVFDRPDQPAAIRVDEVHGVETVAEDDVIGAEEYEPEAIDGTALAHPLISDAVRIERVDRRTVVESYASADGEGAEQAGSIDRSSIPESTVGADGLGDDGDVQVAEFSLDEEAESDVASDPAAVEIEVVPLVDVDRLLLASGPVANLDSVETDADSADATPAETDVGAEESTVDETDADSTDAAREDTDADPVESPAGEAAVGEEAAGEGENSVATEGRVDTEE
ncbi:chemotaxis protein CheW [Halovivax limisalsi]|uniref:chemotaxis protein CheW n=1 Tax=Halovivax limisalsi TaxID=1453760 RepID=UPI001FFDA7DA|nr:chemotaxis protein CheW [Halovivax limisalsi]